MNVEIFVGSDGDCVVVKKGDSQIQVGSTLPVANLIAALKDLLRDEKDLYLVTHSAR